MKKTYIAIAGAMVVAIGLGVGVTASRTYAKGNSNVASVQKIVDNKDDLNQTTGDENNGTTDTKETVSSLEHNDRINEESSVDSGNTITENISKNSVDNIKTVNENKKSIENSKEESKSDVQIKEENNSIYKEGVTATDIKRVEDNYDNDMNKIINHVGSHFRKTGELVFSGEEGDNARVKLFYDESDSALNNLWSGLQSILSNGEMQKLTTSQKQWIKEKDSIKEDGNSFLSAETRTLYAQGKDTYKRCADLANKYLSN